MSEENKFKSHSVKQESLIFSDAELTIAGTGTQWGKSQGASLWMKRQIHRFTDQKDNFLLLAPTYKIMNQSLLPYFLHYMQGMGEHKKADAEFKLHHGGTVYLRTGTDPDSIVGIPDVRAYWLDEAGLATLYFWENIQARAASKGALGLLTTSPYSRNWLYKDFIKPITAGKKKDVPFIRAASWENPYHSLHNLEKRRSMRSKMDPRRFDMIFGGEWGQMSGLVYDCFDEELNVCEPFRLPDDTKFVAGVDWGYNPDPFVVVVRAILPTGQHIQVSEFYKTGMTISDMVLYCKQLKQTFGIKAFYCDKSQPGSIEEFNRNSLNAIAADNDINRGIGLHYEMIRNRQYKIFKGSSPYTLDELETYHYPEPEDLGPDDDSKEQKPVGQNDHCLDANRYVTISTYRSKNKPSPYAPLDKTQMTNEARWKMLTRKRSSSGQLEE